MRRTSGFRTRACTSGPSSSSRFQEVAPGLEVPGKGSVEAILARLH